MPPTTTTEPIRIGNAQAFWGDDPDAPVRLIRQYPQLDVLTLDYLAEVSLSILAAQRSKDPNLGYAKDFVEVVRSLTFHWKEGGKTRIVTNAGGLNPIGCGQACAEVLAQDPELANLKIVVVTGDDVLDYLRQNLNADYFSNLETGQSANIAAQKGLVTANAYLGAEGIVQALKAGADIVITGRVADPSLVVGPCIAHFGWSSNDYQKIAGATIAGHLIECGTQACGGFSTDWLDLPNPEAIGFPIVEVFSDGSCVLTKPKNTGGAVNLRIVREQLLYEIGDPAHYLSPDATVSFLNLKLEQVGENQVHISGALGSAPPPAYKVSATYRDGFRASAMLTVYGDRAVEKAKRCGAGVLQRLKEANFEPAQSLVECLGTGAATGGIGSRVPDEDQVETVLRIAVADPRKECIEYFSKLMARLVTAGPQGVTGYGVARAKVQPVFGYWPCLVPRSLVHPEIQEIS